MTAVWMVTWPACPPRVEDYDTQAEADVRVAELRRTGRDAVAYEITVEEA